MAFDDRLYAKIDGVFEVTWIAAPMQTNYGSAPSTFMRGYVSVYYMDGTKRKGVSNIQFTADGQLADEIAAMNVQKGDIVKISGKLSSTKETRYKDDKGNEVYHSCIRVETFSTATADATKPKKEYPQKKIVENQDKQFKNTKVEITLPSIDDDDLPF